MLGAQHLWSCRSSLAPSHVYSPARRVHPPAPMLRDPPQKASQATGQTWRSSGEDQKPGEIRFPAVRTRRMSPPLSLPGERRPSPDDPALVGSDLLLSCLRYSANELHTHYSRPTEASYPLRWDKSTEHSFTGILSWSSKNGALCG